MKTRMRNTLLMGMAFGVAANTNITPSVLAQVNEPQGINVNQVTQSAGHAKTNVLFIVLSVVSETEI